jgi:PAS domain S-box-containing protein
MPILPPDAALRLAAVVQSSDDAIVSKDLDGVVTSWNAGAERLFGYTAGEAVGRSIRMLIPADRQDEEDHVLEFIRAGQLVEAFDTIRRRKDGTLVDVSVRVSPILDPSGKIVGASKIARDIAERKRIEAEVRDLQHRLMGLAAASATILGTPDVNAVLSALIELARDVFKADGYAIWRVDDTATWTAVRTLGISEEFVSQPLTAVGDGGPIEPLIVPDVFASTTLANRHDAYRREGIVSILAHPLIIRGAYRGTMVFYSRTRREYSGVDIEVARATANLAAGALTTVELYDEQRAARAAADHSRRRASFLAEAGSVMSASLDYHDTLKAVAQLAVPAVADWCAVDMVDGRGGLERLAVAHVDPEKVALARQLQERYPADPGAPGGIHHVIRTGKASFMTRIPPARLEAVARDDEHRRIIRELNLHSYMCVPLMAQDKAFGAITFVSAESGREYSEDDVRFAQDLAVRASLAVENSRAYARVREVSRLKDEFLATLSHELRTPLNAVLGYARMLRMGTLGPEKSGPALEVLERNAVALKQIIEDVLDVSRIVSGRMRLDVEAVDLPSVLHEATASVMPAAAAKGVQVETVIESLDTRVSGDPGRLQQVVWNLMSNAIKFTPKGGRVQLRLSRVNSHIEIAVTDTGIGIAPDFLPFVFEPFRQADATFSREHGGLGLGLGIAKQLAELHGGGIFARSEGTGRGSTFLVTLPLKNGLPGPPPAKHETEVADRPIPPPESAPSLAGVCVLAVDDEVDSVRLLKAVLENAGASVITATSAETALDLLRNDAPDVMVADIGMPQMDGLQLIRAVRQMDEPARSIPAAALTAYARPEDSVNSLSSGFQMHLVKPIDPVELAVAISRLARVGTSSSPRS